MLQVPAGTNRRASSDFSQDQLALVIDLLRNIIPGHYDSSPMHTHSRGSLSSGSTDIRPSELESLYDDIVSTPPSEESSSYEYIEENRVSTFHDNKSHTQAKPTVPPKPVALKRKKVPNKLSSSRFGTDLRPTGRTGTPSGEEDRRQTISKLLHGILYKFQYLDNASAFYKYLHLQFSRLLSYYNSLVVNYCIYIP